MRKTLLLALLASTACTPMASETRTAAATDTVPVSDEAEGYDLAAQRAKRLLCHRANLGCGLHRRGISSPEGLVHARRREAAEAAKHPTEVKQGLVRQRCEPLCEFRLGRPEMVLRRANRPQLAGGQPERRVKVGCHLRVAPLNP